MEVIPAIDLIKGKVIRLSRGEPDSAKSYERFGDPLQVAKKWELEGARYLHLIDLDAATGRGDNRRVVSEIIRGVGIPVQVGGGIRSTAVVEELLKEGAGRVIIGTLAFERDYSMKKLVEKIGCERIMVALDYLEGMVMVKGWKDSTGLSLEQAMEKFLTLGVKLFLLTSISRDGLLIGPDHATLRDLSKRFKGGLFVAGGVGSLNDLTRLKTIGVDGVVVGKALYEARFSLKDALAVGG